MQIIYKKILANYILYIFIKHMAPNVSKNSKVNRSASEKVVLQYNGKDVEVAPVLFIGKTAGMRNYMAVQEKGTKKMLVDEKGMPLPWKTSKIERKKM